MKTTLNLIALAAITSTSAFAAENTLTIYTYDSFAADWGPGPKIEQAFEAKCGCDVNFVALDDGVSILNRLRLEGGNSKADIVLGLDNNLMAEAKKTGLLTEHNVDTANTVLPNGWSDTTFVPYDYGYFAFVYNKEKLANPPKSMKELVETRDDLKVIYQDPRTSTPGQGLMLWMKSIYGDDVTQAWQKLASKTVTVTKGWSEAYSMFLNGESDLVLSYTTSPAYHLIAENDSKFATANFSEGHYMQVEVAAKVKGSKNSELADKFMNFILSDEFQSAMPTGNWMYPVTDVELPKGFETLSVPSKSLSFSADEVAKMRKSWIREWQSALTF
ncbi:MULTISPECIES: thiamine ABC transporter substrate binding subunit [Vibrio harveyi group]|uniref:thiamine ABC transporter substrate binding subunit n=1 Tax=Vibrio harveyi group TaxID=717610 RepID=UPI001BD28FA2|nr:thiamine ABC transporter substrate binding subunit [Vibrio parahaemolyticus]MBS9993291.1 thiamine ABC transporter substrate binding subunit [Vibrio alginolyticus]EGQ8532486.1 thiamine ABC transporter substrate binding subunit [Vibrio parahaemolyticus]EHK9573946.1 thiamine ABC transporter substrate binding subunit [Vibrio parahaemolyticus]EHK9581174.1 thiamine ABC transporter substrate binding subunit [Vibrio parahaemolyticus]EIZ1897769.1 thiamine ABC transporter substrate binding subunit [V